jgi:DNA-binding LytR/AlgR family response regulator
VRGSQGKIELIDTRDIVYLGAEGDYVAIVTASGRWLKEQTLKYFEDALPRSEFVRVHRSYIVSISHISRIESSGRDRSVVLRGLGEGGGNGPGGKSIRISDAGYKLLRRTLGL